MLNKVLIGVTSATISTVAVMIVKSRNKKKSLVSALEKLINDIEIKNDFIYDGKDNTLNNLKGDVIKVISMINVNDNDWKYRLEDLFKALASHGFYYNGRRFEEV